MNTGFQTHPYEKCRSGKCGTPNPSEGGKESPLTPPKEGNEEMRLENEVDGKS
jgi:hypothetical protein